MNLNAALAKSLLMAASIGMVVPLVVGQNLNSTRASTPGKGGKPTTPAPAPETSTETPAEIQLPGIVQPRTGGGFLTVEVVDGKFKVSFYDAKKKQIPADAPRGAARWRTKAKLVEDHTVLAPGGDGKTLVGAGFVRPPYTFRVYLSLLTEEGTAAETYIVDMNSSTPTPEPAAGEMTK